MGSPTARRGRRSPRRLTNITLHASLLTEAKQLGINISEARKAGLSQRVAQVRRQHWLEENREAIGNYNPRIDGMG